MGMANHIPAGTPPAVLVTVLDENKFGTRYMDLVKENRKLYADRHGTSAAGKLLLERGADQAMHVHRLRNVLPTSGRL